MTQISAGKVRSALDKMFRPRSVAIVGASARKGSLGNTVMRKMTDFGFTGEIYPVNTRGGEILGIESRPRVTDFIGDIDLAVICVPAKFVLDVFRDCHEKGIESCAIISAGFKEIGSDGKKLEAELHRLRKEFGMRVVGPNCFGLINGDPAVSMDCTFARHLSARGHMGLVSQSGAVGACIMEDLKKNNLGFSLFVSLGNRSDLDENEALEYLAGDPNTKVILIYLENLADPAKFIEIAGKITPHKPIIALKAGRSAHGAAAAASHTGMLAQSDRLVDTLFEKAGVMRVDSVRDLILAAQGLGGGILPEKDELGVITNAGGFGVMAIDRAEELGLKLAKFSGKTGEFLEENLPVEASCHNPVDLLGTAGFLHYETALEGLLSDDNVGGVVCNFGPPVMQSAEEIADVVVKKAGEYRHKPVLSVYMNRYRIMKAIEKSKDVYASQFDSPEDAVWAYSQILRYKKIKNKNRGEFPQFKADGESVSKILSDARGQGRDRLDFHEGEAVLKAYGIPVANSVLVKPGDDLEEKLSGFRFPAAVKPDWGGVTHKTEMKAVRINLPDVESVEEAVREIGMGISNSLGKRYRQGFIVQEMARECREVIIGAARQESGIHMIMFGLGGIFVELLKDVAFGIPPLTDAEAVEMMEKIKGYPLLKGFRGEEGINLENLRDVILKVSQLVAHHPEIKELDINPFMASSVEGKSAAVDVRIII